MGTLPCEVAFERPRAPFHKAKNTTSIKQYALHVLPRRSPAAVRRIRHGNRQTVPTATVAVLNSVCSSDDGSQEKLESAAKNCLQEGSEQTLSLAALFSAGTFPILFAGGGGNSGSGIDGGGGGDGGGSGFNVVADIAANTDEDEEEEEEDEEEEDEDEEDEDEDEESDDENAHEDTNEFYCQEVVADGLPSGPGVPTEEDLFAGLVCQPGFRCTKKDLQEDLRTLIMTGLFSNVDVRVTPLPMAPLPKGKGKGRARKRYRVTFVLSENLWQPLKSFKVQPHPKNKSKTLLIPQSEVDRVMKEVAGGPEEAMGMVKLSKIKDIIEGWYQKRGFIISYIQNFEGMESGDIVAKVVEGRVSKISVVNIDDSGKPIRGKGEVSPDVVLREVPFKEGQLYNAEDSRKALRDVFDLNLYENVQILPRQNPKDETKVEVDVMVKERPMKTVDLEMEWALVPGGSGPVLATAVPGGSITFEHRNLQKKGRTASVSVTTGNFMQPADDLGYRVDYKHPYIFGDDDPNRTALCATAFNSRRISGIFTGSQESGIPNIFVDRTGAKVYLQESLPRNSKATYGVVLEQLTTRDETGALVTHGAKMTPLGVLAEDGPPTTLGDTGVDTVAFLQGSVTRDNTYLLNGTPVGGRDIFLVDQGLGLGTAFPFFNRHQISATRFLPLLMPKATSSNPPPVLVLHGRYGGIVGDLASYDTFTLGGPHSVRGFSVGEVGAARRFLEGAVELRLSYKDVMFYGFAEGVTDLGSSKEVRGNPTQYFNRPGIGHSLGAGVKVGGIRAEYVSESTTGRSSIFVRFGERF